MVLIGMQLLYVEHHVLCVIQLVRREPTVLDVFNEVPQEMVPYNYVDSTS